jgi:hypothetical protein
MKQRSQNNRSGKLVKESQVDVNEKAFLVAWSMF